MMIAAVVMTIGIITFYAGLGYCLWKDLGG